ncbi:TRAFs-binding domain-containing protein [Sulfurovum sp.]|uniref:TRAFs-binding domain-containing protein n=1 Tax=Sulfurovum sp. TaxID=1969726 RepID=UPI0025DEC65A|nr:TRAFs-binding domain-containing protein [Sulfurovum sp.]
MPFGTKPDADGTQIDFNRIYIEYIKPALETAGLKVFRADEEQRAGEIRKDMFFELLVADLVVVDLTIDNANVWYELGVRHALRARGVVLICGGNSKKAFDVYTDRKLHYNIKNGTPDSNTLEEDIKNLTIMVKKTMESWHGRKISPVFDLLPNLQEPDWKSLRVGNINQFWEEYDAWKDKIILARKNKLIGDILVLADEAPIAAFRVEAWIQAGQALRKAERYDFALEQLERSLDIEPQNLQALHEKGICLQRLALEGKPSYSLEKARQHYLQILRIEKYEDDPETLALLGRVDKDVWVASWREDGASPEQMLEEATEEDALLRVAIESYRKAYQANPLHYYSGINAMSLMQVYQHLTKDDQYQEKINILSGAIGFAAKIKDDFWSLATLGDLEILTGTPESVKKAYKEAIAKSDKNWFALNSTLSQLYLLKDLDFMPENVASGVATFERAIQKAKKPKERWQPRNVFLFSGHMIDTADRESPRFPSNKEEIAGHEILSELKKLGANSEDIAFTQGACGGDILFTEACQKLGVHVQWLQPFMEPEFIERSVIKCGESWRDRYNACKNKLSTPIRSAPMELGELSQDVDIGYSYERCNLWLLYTALSYGIDKVHFISLWDGKGGDGPGGTADMYKQIKSRTGNVNIIKTQDL